MKSIYQISEEYSKLSESLIESGGELTEDLEKALAINKEELQLKGVNYAFVIKGIEADCEVIEKEITRLSTMYNLRHNAIDRLKKTLSLAMQFHGIEEIKTPLIKINFRKSESTEVNDIALLDPKFIKTIVSKTADKTKIKEAIKSGEVVVGAVIKENRSLQIK